MKRTLLAFHCILVAIFIFAPAALAQKLVIAWTAVSAFNSPFWIMSDAGLYKEEGLDVDTMYIASSPIAAKATLAGEVVISAQNSQVIADSGLQGADLVAIGATVNIVPFYVMATPEIKSVTDLKGKTVGVSRFGAATDFGMRMFLARHGLAAHRDVAFIQIGGMPEIAAALSKKIIAAAPMSYPMVYVAEQGGAKVLANLAKDEIPFVHLTLTTTKRFLKDKRPQAKAFLRAYGKAMHSRPEQFFDNSIIQELVDEGFFARLWGKNP